MNLFWLSFCDGDQPSGSQFLGACIVEGGDTGDHREDFTVAIKNAWRAKCNPGGEVRSMLIDQKYVPLIGPEWKNRILTRDECGAFERDVFSRFN